MKVVLLTILALFSILLVNGQDYYPPIENYSTNIYGKDRNPENYAIVQDDRGVMYFGNSNGVMEYDGTNWRFIEVKIGAYVYSLAKDSAGTVYVGSQDEFGYFKPNKTGALIYESLSQTLSEIDRVQITEVRYIYTSKDYVYFQSKNNVFVYNIKDKFLENIKTTESFHTSYLVGDVFYVRERNVGIKFYKDGKLQLLRGTDYFKSNPFFGAFAQPNDGLLFFTQTDGIYKWQNNQLDAVEGSKQALEGVRTFGVKLLSDGNYALRTFESGVFIVDAQGNLVHQLNRVTGLRSDDIKAMFEDRDQNLWLGLGNGIAKVNYYSPLSFFNDKSGIEGDIQAVSRFNGNLYVASSYGLFIEDTTANKTKKFKQDLSLRFQVWSFEEQNNQLYIGTSEGVFKRIKEGQYEQLNDLNTNAIYYDQQKQLFITSGNSGVQLWDKNFKPLWKEEIGLNTSTGIVKSPRTGNYWIGTSGSGALRLLEDGTNSVLDPFTYEADGLCEDQVTRPLLLNKELVFGCKYGPMRFLDEDHMRELLKDDLTEEELNDPMFVRGIFEPLPLYDSIFENEVLLIEEAEDRTWYVAGHKLGYFSKADNDFMNKPFWGINYGRINTLFLEGGGELWIGCADGLIRYKENQRKNYNSEFTSLIRSITVKNDTIFGGAYNKSEERNVNSFPFANNDFVFHFACPYFEDEHKPDFSTMLEGHDNDWSGYSKATERTFTNLGEGTYTFKVKAKNIYDQLSTIAEYKFTIQPPWYRTVWAYALYVLAFFILLYIATRIASARLKAKNEQLERVVEERTQEISLKNNVLEHKNEEISEQKREIEDSINYAKRIQDAILPLASEMKESLPNSFILYHPKDIVSGDFYWFTKIENRLIIVCADCTGHGVPGAFMSMIGSDRLNIIVNERKILEPGAILGELNRAIKSSLKQKSEESTTRDGMDAAICSINLETNELVFSGAHRGLWIVKDNKLTEIKPTKTAIAGFTPASQVFEEHSMIVEKGMRFYMTTDGYADQFGGDRGKKYMVKKMKLLVTKIADEPFEKQAELLDKELFDWMNNYAKKEEQVDDVCVVGFEL